MRRALWVLAVAGVLAGCSSGPSPVPATPVPATPVPVPRVTAPRDASGLQGCAGPTARLAPDLVSAATATPAGAGCSWTDPSSTAVLRADVRAAGGMDALYRVAGALRAFRTGELSGVPTVVTTPEGDPSCSLHAGLSDGEVLTVQVGPAGAPVLDPCRAAAAAAARLLAAMPPRPSPTGENG